MRKRYVPSRVNLPTFHLLERFEGIPFSGLSTTFPEILAYKHEVKIPRHFAGIFRRGEKILYLHFYAITPAEMLGLLRNFKRRITELKQQGFVGAYGDTPNTALIKILKKFGAKEIEITQKRQKEWAGKRYAKSVKYMGFPPKYKRKPVKRVVFRFQ